MSDSTRRALRTAVAVLLGLAATAPVLVREAGLNPDKWPWLATVLAVCAVITRVMATPTVEAILQRYPALQWLAKAAPDGRHEAGRAEDTPRDAGQGRLMTLAIAVMTIVAFGLAGMLIFSDRADASTRPDHRALAGVTLAVTEARVCDGMLTVHALAIAHGRVADLGQPLLEVRGYGAWAGGVSWVPVDRLAMRDGDVSPGRATVVRGIVGGFPYWHEVRVVLPGSDGQVVSWPVVAEPCA